jgi:AraC-like DNA-binding protein
MSRSNANAAKVKTVPMSAGQLARAPTAAQPVRVLPRQLLGRERIAGHAHPWHQLTLAVSGAFRVLTPESSWVVPPTHAIWIPAHIVHEVETLSNTVLHAVYVRPGRTLRKDCGIVAASPLMREVVTALAVHDSAPDATRERMLGGLLMNELARATPASRALPLPRDRRIRALALALLRDPGDASDIGAWGERIGASPRTIERLFREELHSSFAQWRQQARLAHALTLLSQGTSVGEIAAELGYASQSAFTAMFRKTLGQTPSAFRLQG